MSRQDIARLEGLLGVAFTDAGRVLCALTHPSFGGDHHIPDYQRLEFLGDAALELAMSDLLFERFAYMSEGRLTRLRAQLVREETLAALARTLGLGAMIRLSVGEERSGGADKPSILSDVLEALLACVYLDGGYPVLKDVIARLFRDRLEHADAADPLDDKSRLQEYCQQALGKTPTYTFVRQSGEAHAPMFVMRVAIGEKAVGEGEGASKRLAQQAAAKDALHKLCPMRD